MNSRRIEDINLEFARFLLPVAALPSMSLTSSSTFTSSTPNYPTTDTEQSGAEHARNLEEMFNHDDAISLLLKEFSPARVKAIRAMLLQGRTENDKAELIRKYPQIFHGAAPPRSAEKKKS
jgi:hypothetical protein